MFTRKRLGRLMGAPVADLPQDAYVQKFSVLIDGFILRVEESILGGRWLWGVFAVSDNMKLLLSGESRTVGEAVDGGIAAVAKARLIDAEPW